MTRAEAEFFEELRRQIDSGSLVLFVGNGVRRVPTSIVNPSSVRPRTSKADLGPSWQSYMESLWKIVKPKKKKPKDDDLDFRAFSRLTAPRQAEWFDRRIATLPGATSQFASILRMHLLGLGLHPREGIPTNPLLKVIAEITLGLASARREQGVDLITTNVDCAIEQNIAWAADETGVETKPSLIVKDAQHNTAAWRTGKPSGAEIRIWKIHGCLNAVKRLPGIKLDFEEDLRKVRMVAKGRNREFAGAVPTDKLWPRSEWRNDVSLRDKRIPSVFSMTEYVSLLDKLLASKSNDLRKLFSNRPILFIGYDMHEVDVDVVAILHRSKSEKSPRYALRSRVGPNSELHEEERLRQMGVDWWSFRLPPLASARLPGEMRLMERHEWRYGRKGYVSSKKLREDLDNLWREKLQDEVAQIWLEAQESKLRLLINPDTPSTASEIQEPETRLVIAGLASMWHAFALKKPADMPSRRRVSASLAAVDSEVPGGSGLVPAMVAAAVAGPRAVGQLTFLTNTPKQWTQWDEVEEFCLSGGIDIRPLHVQKKLDKNVGARTSHVLLYDPDKNEEGGWQPRQRMIMDVDELVEPARGGSIGRAVAPKVNYVPDLGAPNHLLFGDKLVSQKLLAKWGGPIVFETGSSGDELLDQKIAPSFWTAGFGSFIRTLVGARLGSNGLAGRKAVDLPQNMKDALRTLRDDPDLREFVDEAAPGKEYVARINSFNKKLWPKGGVIHSDEVKYGEWVQRQWHKLSDIVWNIIDHPATGRSLVSSHKMIGRGILTTLHEKGLMAYFDLKNDSKRSIVVSIETDKDRKSLQFSCRTQCSSETPQIAGSAKFELNPAREDGSETTGLVTIPGAKTVEIPVAERLRRHTLGAGDTVRGCLAYGLWAWAFEKGARRPGSVEHVLLASCFLASLKSYAGSFVEFLRVVDNLRETDAWKYLWGFAD